MECLQQKPTLYAPGVTTLDTQLHAAFELFAEELAARNPYARERELVSLFAFGPLLSVCRADHPLFDPRQIGVEVAVPPSGTKPQTNKDLVIWPDPWQTLWNEAGEHAHQPLAILEWKGGMAASARALSPSDRKDISTYLSAQSTPPRETEGYFVHVTGGPRAWRVSVTRYAKGHAYPGWFEFPRGAGV